MRVLPLGGLGRFGGNLMVYETAADLFVVDCGFGFPQASEPGVDWLAPDLDYLLSRSSKLRAYVITHGHEDHIGALPWALAQAPAPVYGTRFTLRLVQHKLGEREMSAELHELRDGERVELGEIAVVPIAVAHSIPGAVALALETPAGVVIHTGDFKLDQEPVDGRPTDTDALDELGRAGVTALLSDSTNAQTPGHTRSERSVREVVGPLIAAATERVLVTTFSSNVNRLQTLIDASAAAGRRVIPIGRSCRQTIQMARETGHLKVPHGLLEEPERYANIPRDRLTVIAAGCQAEEYSAFATIARGDHGRIRLEPGDLALLSARRIPGNERGVGRAIDALLRQGVRVIDDRREPGIHASGHAQRDEQRRMIELCAPRFFIPIHGERSQLQAHAETAEDLGVEVLLTEDGRPVELTRDGEQISALRATPVEAGYLNLDGDGAVPEIVLRDRRVLSAVGFVGCVLVLDPAGRLLARPEITTRGVVYVDENLDLLADAADEVEDAIDALAVSAGDEEIHEAARLALRRFFRRELGRRPMILPTLLYLDEESEP